ncbi:AMP-binding protein [Brevundimonas sp.]
MAVRSLRPPGGAVASPHPVGDLLNIQAARSPDAPALTCDGVTLTRRELAERVNRRARVLADLGVGEGDFVAIVLPNGAAFLEIAYAVWALGGVPAPLSHRLADGELAAILDLLNPRLVLIEEASRAPGRHTVSADGAYDVKADASPLPPTTSPCLKAIASGGSTGRPKVIVDSAPALNDPDMPVLAMQPGDVVLNPGPLYHSAPFGVNVMALGWGMHVVMTPRFDPVETLRLIERHRVTWLFQVPTMMHRIWTSPERERFDVSSLQAVLHIAAPCPAWLKRAWIGWVGAETIWEIYTGTESMGGTAINGLDWLERPGSVGRVLPGYSMKLLDEDGAECAPGQIGEVYFLPDRGQGATYRYIGAEARTAGVWETFGDMGHVDEDGFLFLADRRVDLIVSGGANIYPAEVEAAIDAFPGVLCSVVIGLPDADLGHRAHAIVQTEAVLDEAALSTFLAERLAPFKRPRSFEATTEALRDDAGKVRRRALRETRLQTNLRNET